MSGEHQGGDHQGGGAGQAGPADLALLDRFRGGRTLTLALGAGAAGLALTLVGGLAQPRQALISYLTAFVFWLIIALGGLILVMVFNTAGARWMVVLRRAMETIGAALPAFLVLFLPIALGARLLYVWVAPPADASRELLEAIHHKGAWFSLPSFYLRAGLYFAVFILISQLIYGWSNQQDRSAAAVLTVKARRLSAGALPFLAMALSFASFDWILSATPTFYSTMYGLYWFAEGFLGAIAVLVIATARAGQSRDTHGPLVSLAHWHNLGKLLLAFTAFWAYIAFSQYMLIWIANLPEEVPWYIQRSQGAWKLVFAGLIGGHFILPFFLLLSRDLKLQPARLSLVAALILLGCWADIYWLVAPQYQPESIIPHWTQLTALVGVGGAAVAFALFRARGRYPVPVGDPYLDDSLRYQQP